ncbi:MFS transporter [Rhodovulum sp. DZ06]|uniref:MFS transporter n=1 Tax=Rhodovulum sp. DZ06 TaxID=3425126 RepID=UPI003D34EE49
MTAPPTPDARPSPAGLFAAIAAGVMSGFSLSMAFPYFGLSLKAMGADNLVIGLNAAAPALAMVLGMPLLPGLIRRLGLPLFLPAAAALCALSLLALPLWRDPAWWTALRFLHGLGVAACFYASELWIVAAAPAARRGRWIGIYGLFLSMGFASGPAALQVMDLSGWGPPLLAAGVSVLSMAPVIAARRAAPGGLGEASSLRRSLSFLRSDPTPMAAAAAFGAVEMGAFAMLPVWGLGIGLSQDAAIRLAVLVALGNVALQVPLGLAADRFDRRMLIALAGLSCVLGAAALSRIGADGPALWLVTAALGGMAVALYSVSLAELGARYEGGALGQAAAAFMTCYGLGALAVPPLMGAAADAAPPHGMLWVLAGTGALCAAVALGRAGRRRGG